MSKVHTNPVRGHVSCPVCQTTATVHQVGEGRLIAGGEPPKNSRNLGLLYYRCPDCGNSSVSKRVDAYIREAQINAQTPSDKVTQPEPVTSEVTDLLEHTDLSNNESHAPSNAQTPSDKVTQPDPLTGQVTEPVTGENALFPTWSKVLLGALGLALFVWWAYQTLMAEEGQDERIA
ncbi:hypothetical protein L3V35_12365 [Vibrio sp. L5-1]|uniref:hypothetical protein n=1 Tax=Vibrio sp. L5-1 TaxID=2912254 RepID=UPI001F1DD661|nr:hypothetical protein [Vibrio sp. L5-1]MCF7495837.1 hypothetical protein [Vibrio sp. L5-1]CAK2315901.1 conserved hypothetical protein [Vibrio crassostreae]